MYRQENSAVMALYAVSPVHAGSGSSMGVVDLPIQRERHTNWPHIQSSGVKGAMRHHFEAFKENITDRGENLQLDLITEMIFGTEDFRGEGTLPGAIAVSDAKIAAFPIRSSKSPFVWITCPAVLKRMERDLKMIGKSGEDKTADGKSPDQDSQGKPLNSRDSSTVIPDIKDDEALVIKGGTLMKPQARILLEDYEVIISEKSCKLPGSVETILNKADNLLLVSDQTFNYGVSHCTEIRTQIKIDEKSGTTVDGSLRYEEVLPSDTLMYVILFYGPTRDARTTIPADTLISYMKESVIRSHIQMGGDETLGYGLFEIEWM
ncbi:MAG: type III-B CRISPR module RAMP protein Cmr4 [Desulfamplus sp.]|nr:type III-B CRISPR module RAMP protein Cmr4 [Desulfamplus sp.]